MEFKNESGSAPVEYWNLIFTGISGVEKDTGNPIAVASVNASIISEPTTGPMPKAVENEMKLKMIASNDSSFITKRCPVFEIPVDMSVASDLKLITRVIPEVRSGDDKKPKEYTGSIMLCQSTPNSSIKLEVKDICIKLETNLNLWISIFKSTYHLPFCMPPLPHLSSALPERQKTRVEVFMVKHVGASQDSLNEMQAHKLSQVTGAKEKDEKIMDMWNRYIRENRITKVSQLALACKRFVEIKGTEIFNEDLHMNFTLQLINLFEQEFITVQDVWDVVSQLNSLTSLTL